MDDVGLAPRNNDPWDPPQVTYARALEQKQTGWQPTLEILAQTLLLRQILSRSSHCRRRRVDSHTTTQTQLLPTPESHENNNNHNHSNNIENNII